MFCGRHLFHGLVLASTALCTAGCQLFPEPGWGTDNGGGYDVPAPPFGAKFHLVVDDLAFSITQPSDAVSFESCAGWFADPSLLEPAMVDFFEEGHFSVPVGYSYYDLSDLVDVDVGTVRTIEDFEPYWNEAMLDFLFAWKVGEQSVYTWQQAREQLAWTDDIMVRFWTVLNESNAESDWGWGSVDYNFPHVTANYVFIGIRGSDESTIQGLTIERVESGRLCAPLRIVLLNQNAIARLVQDLPAPVLGCDGGSNADRHEFVQTSIRVHELGHCLGMTHCNLTHSHDCTIESDPVQSYCLMHPKRFLWASMFYVNRRVELARASSWHMSHLAQLVMTSDLALSNCGETAYAEDAYPGL